MSKPLNDVWTERDFPVLVAVTRRIDSGETTPRVEDVSADIGMSTDDVQLAGAALARRGLVETMGAMQAQVLRFKNLSGQAYLLTGLPPDGEAAIDRLADAVRQAIEQTNDPDEKRSLHRFKDSLIDIPANIASAIMVAVATGATG